MRRGTSASQNGSPGRSRRDTHLICSQASGRGELVGLDRATGMKLWTLQLGKDRYPTQPVAVGGMIIVALDRGPLFGVDLETGEARGAFDPGSGFSQPVYALPGVAYVLSNAGTLFSLGLLP